MEDRWNAEHYKRNSESQFQLGMQVINSLQLKGNESILDVGCGDGRLTVKLAQRIPQGSILGIDISPNMIFGAQKSYHSVPNVSFECIDVLQFMTVKSFDKIISLHAFHWIDDQFKALTNLYACLKPGGELYILMLPSTKNPIDRVMESLRWANVLHSPTRYFHGQIPATIKPLLEQAGFVHIEAYIKTNERIFKNKNELVGWLMGWIPHATGLPEDKAQELAQDIAKNVPHQNGNFICVGDSLHIRAKK